MSVTAGHVEPEPVQSRDGLRGRIAGWARRRPAAAAALIYLLLSFAMFLPGLMPGKTLSASDFLWTSAPWESTRPPEIPLLGSNREQGDAVQMWQPFMEHTRESLPHIPLWNPYIMGGRPFHANLQSATLSPFTVPAYVLPFWDSLAVMAALKLFVAAFGTFLLARRFGLRFPGALLAGLVYGFSLWAVTWVPWTTMSVWALVPWVALAAELCIRSPGPLPFAAMSALVGAQFFAGHPTSSFHLMVFTALFFGVRVLAVPELRRDRPLARLATLGGGLAVGTALAAVTLLPFFELLDHSYDRTVREGQFSDSYAPSRYLLGIFFHDWWGRSTRTALEFAAGLEEHAYYVAALPLMLAVAALALRPRPARVVVAVLGVVAIAAATGLPPAYDLVQALPGFEAVRNGRLAVFMVLSVALLAGWGLDDLMSREVSVGRGRAILAAGAALAVLPVLYVLAAGRVDAGAFGDALRVAWGFATPDTGLAPAEELGDVVRLASVLEWAGVAAVAVLLLVLRVRGRLGATAFAALVLALVAFDLFKAGMGYNPAIEERHAVQPVTAAIRYLQEQRPARFAGLAPTAPVSLAVPMTPSVAMRYGVYDARGYDYPVEVRYADLWKRAITPSTTCNYAFCPESAGTTRRALRALALLGVHDLLQQPRDRPLRGLRMVYEGRDARVYANPEALPRAFVVDRQRVVSGEDAAREAIVAPDFRARTEAVTEEPIPGLPRGGRAPAGPAGTARITRYEDERVEVSTTTGHPALLVLTDSFFPGWKATVDGEDAPVHRVDYLVRGVPVPAGRHTVRFRYEPASWRRGWIVSLVALVVVLAAVAVGLRRRRAAVTPA